MRRHGTLRAGAQADAGQERLGGVFAEVEHGEAGGPELPGVVHLADHAIGRAQSPGADAGIHGNATLDQLELVAHQVAELHVADGVVHGADEVQVAGLDPGHPVLSHRFAAVRIAAEHGGRDLDTRLDLLGLARDGLVTATPEDGKAVFSLTDEGRTLLSPGMCAGFKAGTGNGHRLVNETSQEVVYLEVGDRSPGDEGQYPDDDIKAVLMDGKWSFQRKDGTPYVER